MKVSKELFTAFQIRIQPLDTQERRARYIRGDFYKAVLVKSLNTRYHFDLYWDVIDINTKSDSIDILDKLINRVNEEGLNLDHIATMLKKIVPDIEGR